MTREDLFRAVGEIREEQIEAAETVKKQISPWRRLGALAACLALAAGIWAAPRLGERMKWRAVERGFEPSATEKEEDAGGGASAGGLDGSDYWTDEPARPGYSTGVEIGQLSGPGDGDTMMGMASCAAWLSPEEIFAQDTAIFRGTVRELHYFEVEPDGGPMKRYYTRALVEVTDSIRGDLTAGETCSLLWLGAKGYLSTSLSGPLENLDAGGDAVFMPIRTDRGTGWRAGNGWFCYADVADFYVGEGMRYVFADTGDGLSFDRSVYEEAAEAETLDEIAAYIREQIGEEGAPRRGVTGEAEEPEIGGHVFAEGTERTQPAAEPVMPQAEPSETADAASPASGPAGAREIPGGAFIGGEKPGGSP